MALEFAPVYTPLVQQKEDGQWYMTPQWLQWFLSSQTATNNTAASSSLSQWAKTTPSFTLTTSAHTLATISLKTGNGSPPNIFLCAVFNLSPAAGSPASFEDCEFTIKKDGSTMESVLESVWGDENTVVMLQSFANNLNRNHTYTFTATGRRLGTPSAISPVVDTVTFSLVGTSS